MDAQNGTSLSPNSKADPPKAAIVCIAKNEDRYIDEWLRYHLKLGFSQAFVYQNDWRYAGNRSAYGESVEWIAWDGPAMQMPAYNDFIQNRRRGFDFAAFIDVDEFVVLKKHRSIRDFISGYTRYPAVGLNWRIFGDSGIMEDDGSNGVLERFTMRQDGFNKHIKSILNLGMLGGRVHFKNPHFAHEGWHSGFTVNVAKTRFIQGPFNEDCDESSCAWINHYRNKTVAEWERKKERGTPDGVPFRPESFSEHNLNDVKDTTARDFMRG